MLNYLSIQSFIDRLIDNTITFKSKDYNVICLGYNVFVISLLANDVETIQFFITKFELTVNLEHVTMSLNSKKNLKKFHILTVKETTGYSCT